MSDITSEASTRASADTNLQNQVNSLNSSVSNGKNQVANAITGKGVAASGSDSFATLANKINQINTISSRALQFINSAYVYGDDKWQEITFDEYPTSIGTQYYQGSRLQRVSITMDVTGNDYGSGPAIIFKRSGNTITGGYIDISANLLKPSLSVSTAFSGTPISIEFTGGGYSSYLNISNPTITQSSISGSYVYETISIPISATNGDSARNYIVLNTSPIVIKWHWYFNRDIRSTVSMRYP